MAFGSAPGGTGGEMVEEDPFVGRQTCKAGAIGDPAIEVALTLEGDGLKEEGEGARGSDRSDKIALGQDLGLTASEVVGGDGERDAASLEGLGRKDRFKLGLKEATLEKTKAEAEIPKVPAFQGKEFPAQGGG